MQKSVFSPEQLILQELLRSLRRERGLRQAALAETLGKPQQFVSRYESGEKLLDFVELRQVCLALGITLKAFVERYEEALSASAKPEERFPNTSGTAPQEPQYDS